MHCEVDKGQSQSESNNANEKYLKTLDINECRDGNYWLTGSVPDKKTKGRRVARFVVSDLYGGSHIVHQVHN
jgi:hypothetical protein